MKDIKARKQSSFMKAPIRILTKARDFYIRSFTGCAGQFDCNTGFGCPTVHVSTLPKSFSVNSSTSTRSYSSAHDDDDFAELVRIASARRLGKKVETEFFRRQQSPTGGSGGTKVLARSQSVAIGRIDEDKACDFGDDDTKVNADVTYPRSRSHTPLSVRNVCQGY